MNELIKVHYWRGRNIVNARELHTFLESKSQFSDWIKDRIKKYQLVETQHFWVFQNILKNPEGGRPQHKYVLTLDIAKHLAMVESNHKGFMAREYFLECERLYIEELKRKAENNIGLTLSDPNHLLMVTQKYADEYNLRIAAEQKIEVLQPKADLMDKVMDMDDMVDIGQAAKLLKLPFGRNKLFKKLREKEIFFKNRNEPMQEYVERGLFILKQKLITISSGDFLVTKILVTQKGLEFINKTFCNTKQLELL